MYKNHANRILEVMNPNQWLTGNEINKLIAEKRGAEEDWGPVSFLISFFSKKIAENWLKDSHQSKTYLSLYDLCEQKAVRKRISIKETGEIIEDVSNKNVFIGYYKFEYQITQPGLKKLISRSKYLQETLLQQI